MDAGSKKRWTFLLLALAATVAAIAFPTEEDVDLVEVATPAPVPAPEPVLPQPVVPVENQNVEWVASSDDPFAPRNWQAPPPPAPAPATQAIVSAPAESLPPPPPPLPYKFVGQMNNGDTRVVYLSRGDQVLLAHQGEVLDGSYKVLAIGQSSIEFEAVSSGLKQTLAIPAQEN